VLTLNVFGDGVRDALDPRARLRATKTPSAAEPAGEGPA
jgi:hypothetical protein